MIEIVLQPRIIGTQDWATIIFVVLFAIIAVVKSVFENRFQDFMKLIISDKYTKIYRDASSLMSGFTIFLFLVQLISISFFIQLTLNNFYGTSKTDWVLFIQICTFLTVFVLSKFLVEKIIATSFAIDEFADQFNLQKVTYRTYIGVLLLPLNAILFYNTNSSDMMFYAIITTIVIANVLTYAVSLKNYQNLLFGKLFYFILYLCALEIAPYYFIFYWFTTS
jgi:hypothetical protein